MTDLNKKRWIIWGIGIVVALFLMIISNIFRDNPNKTPILVSAPKPMVTSFEQTFEALNLDKDYVIQYTQDSKKANFVVEEGLGKNGELIAYSPIVAIFNSDEGLKEELIAQEIFVKSEVDSEEYDFDFKKIIDAILSESGSEFKIYYPSRKSETWVEFYHFLLFTINDGYYPKTDEELENAKQTIEAFLNSKNAEPINNATLRTINGFAKNSIYFMTHADLARLDRETGGYPCRIMYPKTVVYQSYYASFDEIGKVLYDSLDATAIRFFYDISNVGYHYLDFQGYNTKSGDIYDISSEVLGERTTFNGVEIPDM